MGLRGYQIGANENHGWKGVSVEKIDWFKLNERSQKKYETFTASLTALGVALEDGEKLVRIYREVYEDEHPQGWGIVEPEELEAARDDLTESLNSLVAKARKHEAKLKSWEWM